MSKRIRMTTSEERKALTQYKKRIHWKAGTRKKIKQKYNQRERRHIKKELNLITLLEEDEE